MGTFSTNRWRGALLGPALVCSSALQAQPPPATNAPASDPVAEFAGTGSHREAPAKLHPGLTACATARDFLVYHDLNCAQTGGMPLPAASPAQLEQNKELVMRFYQGDLDVLADQFIQHDPAEPSTRTAWKKFFSYRSPGNSHPRTNLGGPMGYGKGPVDAAGSPINYLIAEGDIVVALRFRWWPWENGPEPVYKGVFADIWRIKDGKLAEQWCSCTPEDATEKGIEQAKQEGNWVKFKNLNEQ